MSGILHVLRNRPGWQDAPSIHRPHKTPCNRFARWPRLGVFARIVRDLARPGPAGDTPMIDGTRLRARHTAASPRKGGSARVRPAARKEARTPVCTWSGTARGGHSPSSSRPAG
nr:hypothetical protein [Rubellimicrobium aerolatum]